MVLFSKNSTFKMIWHFFWKFNFSPHMVDFIVACFSISHIKKRHWHALALPTSKNNIDVFWQFSPTWCGISYNLNPTLWGFPKWNPQKWKRFWLEVYEENDELETIFDAFKRYFELNHAVFGTNSDNTCQMCPELSIPFNI